MQLDAIERRDLHRACLHEFAHLHVARHFGVWGRVVIERNPDGGIYETHWAGRFEIYNAAPSRRAEVVIGLAGACAEWLDFEWHVTPAMVLDAIDEGTEQLSPTDAAKVGAVTLPKVRASMDLVRRLWPGIKADAELHVATEVRGEVAANKEKAAPKAA